MATTVSLNDENRIHPIDTGMASDQNKGRLRGDEQETEETTSFGLCGQILIFVSYILVVLTCPVAVFYCTNVSCSRISTSGYFPTWTDFAGYIKISNKNLLVNILLGGAKGPGLFFILPCIDTIVKVDLRTTIFNVPPHEILTRDSVTVTVDAVIYSRVIDPVASVTRINNIQSATQLLAQTTLRNILGTKTLHDILTDREGLANSMETHLDQGTGPWGVKVERVEIKDVRLPQSMQRSMAAEAEASREARTKVIAAEGEQKASRQLKEAADVIATSPTALQLRYLQTLTQISAEKNSTIIFPVPIDLLQTFKQGH
ncbi:unnamed protein product [Adineta ricciae]|uniref:Band 7 domain-containing protein n=1 Tax=Adineta ricciae TaxID=249248 RepID=A0A814W838_ADIRI|nr:unnamed protein product [Adineta ricciae]